LAKLVVSAVCTEEKPREKFLPTSISKKIPAVLLKGLKLCSSVPKPVLNKYGDLPTVLNGIFIIKPGLVYATRVAAKDISLKVITITNIKKKAFNLIDIFPLV
jgi:hypothetical protein